MTRPAKSGVPGFGPPTPAKARHADPGCSRIGRLRGIPALRGVVAGVTPQRQAN